MFSVKYVFPMIKRALGNSGDPFHLTQGESGDTIMADNRAAYGLAKKYGIDTTGMTPKQVWDAHMLKKIAEHLSLLPSPIGKS